MLGHDVWSCDILPTEQKLQPTQRGWAAISAQHIQGDVRTVLKRDWDMLIAFPPCTHLSSSGARYWSEKKADGRQDKAISFVLELWQSTHIPHICIENPVGILSNVMGPPTQIIHPFMFGHAIQKSTCLWLSGLPQLRPTQIVSKGDFYIGKNGKKYHKWLYSHSSLTHRAHMRSRTFQGIAAAMATQWGKSFKFQPSLGLERRP